MGPVDTDTELRCRVLTGGRNNVVGNFLLRSHSRPGYCAASLQFAHVANELDIGADARA